MFRIVQVLYQMLIYAFQKRKKRGVCASELKIWEKGARSAKVCALPSSLFPGKGLGVLYSNVNSGGQGILAVCIPPCTRLPSLLQKARTGLEKDRRQDRENSLLVNSSKAQSDEFHLSDCPKGLWESQTPRKVASQPLKSQLTYSEPRTLWCTFCEKITVKTPKETK